MSRANPSPSQDSYPNPEKRAYGVVFVTTSSEIEGRSLAKTLLAEQLAACVSLFPIQSLYTWQNELHQETEWQLVIKTDLALFPTLETRIRSLHSYEVPEIIALPITVGSPPYLQWIDTHVLYPSG